MDLQIRIDPLTGPEVAALLREHLDEMQRISPPESVHALDLAKLRQADITMSSGSVRAASRLDSLVRASAVSRFM